MKSDRANCAPRIQDLFCSNFIILVDSSVSRVCYGFLYFFYLLLLHSYSICLSFFFLVKCVFVQTRIKTYDAWSANQLHFSINTQTRRLFVPALSPQKGIIGFLTAYYIQSFLVAFIETGLYRSSNFLKSLPF